MKLYYAPRTRATRPRWLLEELDVPYELVRLDLSKGEHRTPEFLAINPAGEPPALVDGERTLVEPASICIYLADRFAEKGFAPAAGTAERAAYLQWMLFAEGSIEPTVLPLLRHSQLPEDAKAAVPEADLKRMHARVKERLNIVDKELKGRMFLVGEAFSAADLVLASILHLANTLGLLQDHPKLTAYVVEHTKRPAARRAVS